jgi:hypothetical protein
MKIRKIMLNAVNPISLVIPRQVKDIIINPSMITSINVFVVGLKMRSPIKNIINHKYRITQQITITIV